jgi:hypothetical protein
MVLMNVYRVVDLQHLLLVIPRHEPGQPDQAAKGIVHTLGARVRIAGQVYSQMRALIDADAAI